MWPRYYYFFCGTLIHAHKKWAMVLLLPVVLLLIFDYFHYGTLINVVLLFDTSEYSYFTHCFGCRYTQTEKKLRFWKPAFCQRDVPKVRVCEGVYQSLHNVQFSCRMFGLRATSILPHYVHKLTDCQKKPLRICLKCINPRYMSIIV